MLRWFQGFAKLCKNRFSSFTTNLLTTSSLNPLFKSISSLFLPPKTNPLQHHPTFTKFSYFSSKFLLPLLSPTQTQGDAFVCPVCVQRFSSSKSLLNHQSLHYPQNKGQDFTCSICTSDLKNCRDLLSHLSSSKHKEMKVSLGKVEEGESLGGMVIM